MGVSYIGSSLAQSRYISPVTVVDGGDGVVRERSYMGRVMTANALAPYGRVLVMKGLRSVCEYFGYDSEEYAFAKEYFGFESTLGSKAEYLSFARYSDTGNGFNARLIGGRFDLASLDAIRMLGEAYLSFHVQTTRMIAGYGDEAVDRFPVVKVTGLSAVRTVSDLVGKVNAALSDSSLDDFIRGAVLSYDGRRLTVDFPSGIVYAGYCVPSEISELMRLTEDEEAVASDLCPGVYGDDSKYVQAAESTYGVSCDFGSMTFLGLTLPVESVDALAEWIWGKTIRLLLVARCEEEDAVTYAGEITVRGGVAVVAVGEGHDEALPMAMLAATDYWDGSARENWMYQTDASESSTVTGTDFANDLDGACVNYIGVTQDIARNRSFYQRGVNLDGMSTAKYCSEMWLRDAISDAILSGLLKREKVGVDDVGSIATMVTPAFSKAKRNGVIEMPDEGFSNAERLAIDGYFGGVEGAYRELEGDGYGFQAWRKGTNLVGYRLAYVSGGRVMRIDGEQTVVGV